MPASSHSDFAHLEESLSPGCQPDLNQEQVRHEPGHSLRVRPARRTKERAIRRSAVVWSRARPRDLQTQNRPSCDGLYGGSRPLSNSGTGADLGTLKCSPRTDETLGDINSFERHTAFDRPTGPITTQSAYGGKFSTSCLLPPHSLGSRLSSPPALRMIKKIRAGVGGISCALGRSEVTTQFAYAQEFLCRRHGSHSRSHKDRKATTQRANGKRAAAFRVRAYSRA